MVNRKSRLSMLLVLVMMVFGCEKSDGLPDDSDNALVHVLRRHHPVFQPVIGNPDKFRLQILYTQIDRDDKNEPSFVSHQLFLNNERYFYPASTVKLPAAMLSLEKLNNLNIDNLNRYTALRIDSAAVGQSTVSADSSAPDGYPTIANYIRKIMLVSDNDAFNRLYEFLGQQYLRETLAAKGFKDSWIIRRLESGMDPKANRLTNPFLFYGGENIFYEQGLVENDQHYKIEMLDVKQGIGVMRGGELNNEPIDFSYSNYVSIQDMQDYLKAIFFPMSLPENRRFNLSEDDRTFLATYMGYRPRESGMSIYADTSKYYDSYVKYFMYGDQKEPIPKHIRIFNKVGQAYGYLIDNAYIIDLEKNIEFMLTAVIQVNENQIYNDNNYEYDAIGYPFLAELGRRIYEMELVRPRTHLPDLSRWDLFKY